MLKNAFCVLYIVYFSIKRTRGLKLTNSCFLEF